MATVWPETVCGDQTWRGLSYIAGSWIGGGANAVAMVGIFEPSTDAQSQSMVLGYESRSKVVFVFVFPLL